MLNENTVSRKTIRQEQPDCFSAPAADTFLPVIRTGRKYPVYPVNPVKRIIESQTGTTGLYRTCPPVGCLPFSVMPGCLYRASKTNMSPPSGPIGGLWTSGFPTGTLGNDTPCGFQLKACGNDSGVEYA